MSPELGDMRDKITLDIVDKQFWFCIFTRFAQVSEFFDTDPFDLTYEYKKADETVFEIV